MTRRAATTNNALLNQRAIGGGAAGCEMPNSLINPVAYFTIMEDCHGED